MPTEIRVCKKFEVKNFGDYSNLYVQSYTLLLANVFENFQSMCLEKYEMDPACFFKASRLAWQASLQKDQTKIRSFSWYQCGINGRKRYPWWNVPYYSSICKS